MKEVRRGDASRRMETGVLRSDRVESTPARQGDQDPGGRRGRGGAVSIIRVCGGRRDRLQRHDGDQGEDGEHRLGRGLQIYCI